MELYVAEDQTTCGVVVSKRTRTRRTITRTTAAATNMCSWLEINIDCPPKVCDTLVLQIGVGREAKNLTPVKYVIVEKPNNGRRLDNSDKRPRESNKIDDFYIATWYVLSLFGAGTVKQLKTELEKYRIDTAAEIRCRGVECWIQGTAY